jgi:hypothetical protein
MSLCERGEQQKASDVLVSLKESGYVVDERTLKDVRFYDKLMYTTDVQVTKSGYLRSLTSEETINKFLSLFAEHFTITNNQRHHLVDLVQSNALRTLINENKLVDANDMIARLGDVS